MQLDYSLLLDNVRRRRYDEAIRTHVLSASFEDKSLPAPIRYAFESLIEVDEAYAYKVHANSRKVHHELSTLLQEKQIHADFRYYGPLRTETHIRLYGEIELLCILPENTGAKDISEVGEIIRDAMLKKPYIQQADYGDTVKVKLLTQKPGCRINVVPCLWINNPEYVQSKHEMFRGVAHYNFKEKTRRKHLPFLNMARMHTKDQNTSGHYTQLVRLLKSLSVDGSIALSDYEISGMLYAIPDERLQTAHEKILELLPLVSEHLDQLLFSPAVLEKVVSPSKRELVFGNHAGKIDAVKKLKVAVDKLIEDLRTALNGDLSRSIQYRIE